MLARPRGPGPPAEAVHAHGRGLLLAGEPLAPEAARPELPQISGIRSGALRFPVRITRPPVAHSRVHASPVRSMSESVMFPNTPQSSTMSAGVIPAR